MNKVEARELRDADKPVVVGVDFSVSAFVQPVGNQNSGYLPSFISQANRYRTVTDRKYPFSQLLENSLHLNTAITLPTDFFVASLPSPFVYDGPTGQYWDNTCCEDGTIRYSCDMVTKHGQFSPDSLLEDKKGASILAPESRNHLQFFLHHQ